jgi:hypothetical protein
MSTAATGDRTTSRAVAGVRKWSAGSNGASNEPCAGSSSRRNVAWTIEQLEREVRRSRTANAQDPWRARRGQATVAEGEAAMSRKRCPLRSAAAPTTAKQSASLRRFHFHAAVSAVTAGGPE